MPFELSKYVFEVDGKNNNILRGKTKISYDVDFHKITRNKTFGRPEEINL